MLQGREINLLLFIASTGDRTRVRWRAAPALYTPGEWARTASSRRHTQTYEKKPNSKHCKQLLFYLIYLDYDVDPHRSMKYLI